MKYRFIKKLIEEKLRRLYKSIWLFPTIVILFFIMLVSFGINGSSLGKYNEFINGNEKSDPKLIIGKPRSIRSDEFLVNTQMLISQQRAGYPSVNPNIGAGQDMNILLGSPTQDWIKIFRPENYGFYLIPFDNAFSYRWWLGAVICLVSGYFFALHFLKRRRLLASLLSISLYFTAFIQWWSVSTLIGYSLLLGLLAIKLIDTKESKYKLAQTIPISYIMVVFALNLYPPFQIPCIIVMVLFVFGYLLNKSEEALRPVKFISKNMLYIIIAALSTVTILFSFIQQHREVIDTISNTAYPGKRIINSGAYSFSHLLSGQLAVQHLTTSTSSKYIDYDAGVMNQSETSSFIFLSFYLLIPYLYLVFRRTKLGIKKYDGQILYSLLIVFILFFAWTFVPDLDLIGKLTKLNLVSQNRLIIGFVLLNYLTTIMFIRLYSNSRKKIDNELAILYSFLVFIAVLAINFIIQIKMPGFINNTTSFLLAIPIALIIYFLIQKKNIAALILLLMFTLFGSIAINPVYIGTSTLTDNPIYRSIAKYPDTGRWAVENLLYENFPAMANKHTLTGVYAYPQLDLWKSIDDGKSIDKYNRYAHVTFEFDKSIDTSSITKFADTGADQLIVRTEMCSHFIKNSFVSYVFSSYLYSATDQACIKNIETITTPVQTYYIYSLRF